MKPSNKEEGLTHSSAQMIYKEISRNCKHFNMEVSLSKQIGYTPLSLDNANYQREQRSSFNVLTLTQT